MKSASSTSVLSPRHELKYLSIPGKAIFSWLNTWLFNLEMLDVVNMIQSCCKSGGKCLKLGMRRQWEEISPHLIAVSFWYLTMKSQSLIWHYRNNHWSLLEVAWDDIQWFSPSHSTFHIPSAWVWELKWELPMSSGSLWRNRGAHGHIWDKQKFIILDSSFTFQYPQCWSCSQLPARAEKLGQLLSWLRAQCFNKRCVKSETASAAGLAALLTFQVFEAEMATFL